MTKTLRLFTDGAARGNPGPAGAGIVVEDENRLRLQGRHRWLGTKTNNEAEYLALIEGLKTVAEWTPDRVEVFLDSKLVVEQMNGAYKIKKPELQQLAEQAKQLLRQVNGHISHVERERNRGADALANRAIDEHGKG